MVSHHFPLILGKAAFPRDFKVSLKPVTEFRCFHFSLLGALIEKPPQERKEHHDGQDQHYDLMALETLARLRAILSRSASRTGRAGSNFPFCQAL